MHVADARARNVNNRSANSLPVYACSVHTRTPLSDAHMRVGKGRRSKKFAMSLYEQGVPS
jgi:hypothetical protein